MRVAVGSSYGNRTADMPARLCSDYVEKHGALELPAIVDLLVILCAFRGRIVDG